MQAVPQTLRARLALASGALVLLACAAFTFAFAERYSRLALADQGDALSQFARSNAAFFADGLHERLREVERTAAAPPPLAGGALDPAAWRAVIERLQQGRAHHAWIGVLDADGRVVSATGGLLAGAT